MAGRRKRGRKTTRRRTTKRRTSPLGNLAKKVSGIDSRVHGLESEIRSIPKRFVKRKWKGGQKLGDIEARGPKYWATGE